MKKGTGRSLSACPLLCFHSRWSDCNPCFQQALRQDQRIWRRLPFINKQAHDIPDLANPHLLTQTQYGVEIPRGMSTLLVLSYPFQN